MIIDLGFTLFLLILGVVAWLQSMCIATSLPDHIPGTVGLEVCVLVASAVGVVVTSAGSFLDQFDLHDAVMFAALLVVTKLVNIFDLKHHGFTITKGSKILSYSIKRIERRRSNDRRQASR